MTQRQTNRSRVLRRIGVAVATTIAISTVASTTSHAATSAADTPKYGGEVKVGIFDTFPGFCVGNNPANSALMATRSVYEGLVEKTRGGDFIGLLAKSFTPSADLKTWDVALRPGITFSNGQAFDADAVVENINFMSGRMFAGALQAALGAGRTLAQAQGAAVAAYGYTLGTSVSFEANFKTITKIDASTVRFTLDRAQNDFPGTLYASGRGFMRAKAQLNSSTGCANTPVGTGPFKVVSWDTNTMIVEKNPTYWRTDPTTNAKLPYLDKITFTNVKEASQRSSAIRRGSLDAGMFSGGTDATFIKDLRLRKSVATEYKSPYEYYPSLWLNQTKAGSPFSSKNARLAVTSCIDRATYVKVRNRGEGLVADSIVGKTNPMYTTRGFSKFSVKDSQAFVAAWQAEAGNTGKTLTFTIPADTSSASQANLKFLQQQWAKCGITANVTVEETGPIIAKAFNSSAAGGAQMGYDALVLLLFEGTDVAFNLPFAVTNTFTATGALTSLFGTSLGTLLNLNHHTDTAVDKMLFDGQASATKAGAKAKYQEATAYLQTNGFMTAIQHQYYTLFTSKKLAGIGSLAIEKGKTQRLVTNWGIDWTGVYKKA
jgi:peptide/nickel transport system substrate-binding protein